MARKLKKPDGFAGEVYAVRESKPTGTYPLDQVGAAALFAATFGHEVRWVQAEHRWYIASRKSRPNYWSPEDREGILARMRGVAEEMALRARIDNRPRIRSSAFINGATKLVRAICAAQPAVFNSDPLLFGAPNGVIELDTGRFRDVQRSDMLTTSAAVSYDPEAECPSWLDHLRVLTRIEEDRDGSGDEEMIAYLQELVGMSLIGEQREHAFVYLYGYGRNGKGVFIDTVRSVLGGYADLLDQMVLFQQADAHTTGLTDLRGKRLVTTDELDGRRQINTALLKKLTGGGEMKARRIRENNVTFKMTHTLWLVSNYQPNLGVDSSEGLWNRVLIVETGPTIPKEQRSPDAALRGTLRDEGPGILRWAVEGAVRYLSRGKFPELPLRVRSATEAFAGQSRLMRRFIDEHGIVVPGESRELREVRELFTRWLELEGSLPREGVSSAFVGSLLRQEGFKVDKGAKNKTYVFGLRIAEVPAPALLS